MLNFNFSENIENFLKIIAKSALEQNTRVFFVGGIVRDNLLNVQSDDVDILVLGNAVEFAQKLPNEIKIKSIHKDFCTVKVLYNDIVFDIASTRTETYPHSGCLPVLDRVGVELADDVKRRDFSVNSLYSELRIDENNNLTYELIDLVNGVADIKNRTLRVLHDKSYIDDPTRILRGVGFKYRFNFDFSSCDKNLIKQYLSKSDSSNASYDRIYAVFKKILSLKNNFEIFQEIVNEKYYKILFDCDLNIDFDDLKDIILKFKPDTSSFCAFALMIFENKDVEQKEFLKPIDVYNFFSKYNESFLTYYYYKTKSNDVLKFLEYKNIKLLMNGKELIKLGYTQGKIFRTILNELQNEKLLYPNSFKTLEDETDWVVKKYPII